MNKQYSKLEDFMNRHNIRILDTNKKAIRGRINVEYFTFRDDYNRMTSAPVHQTEPLYTIEISESELYRISDFESEVFNNMQSKGHYNIFEVLMEQKEEEKRLRNEFPAVKKLYEQYSMMLSLAKSGKI